ncbi:hypothetical protein LTR66_010137 [Elasticomyces elasticus]|nr:hypothetical protein LTR66_010137 [Elasticomyces elasticus]KAK5008779.1 hypothetical protein LTR28_003520 [Elasticomyces elasticus]
MTLQDNDSSSGLDRPSSPSLAEYLTCANGGQLFGGHWLPNLSQTPRSFWSILDWMDDSEDEHSDSASHASLSLRRTNTFQASLDDAILKETTDLLEKDGLGPSWSLTKDQSCRLLSSADTTGHEISALATETATAAETTDLLLHLIAAQLLASCYTTSHELAEASLPAALYLDRQRGSRLISSLQSQAQYRYSPAAGHQARDTSPAPAWPGLFTGPSREEKLAQQISRQRLVRKLEAQTQHLETLEEFVKWSNDIPIDPTELLGTSERLDEFIRWSNDVRLEPSKLARVYTWASELPHGPPLLGQDELEPEQGEVYQRPAFDSALKRAQSGQYTNHLTHSVIMKCRECGRWKSPSRQDNFQPSPGECLKMAKIPLLANDSSECQMLLAASEREFGEEQDQQQEEVDSAYIRLLPNIVQPEKHNVHGSRNLHAIVRPATHPLHAHPMKMRRTRKPGNRRPRFPNPHPRNQRSPCRSLQQGDDEMESQQPPSLLPLRNTTARPVRPVLMSLSSLPRTREPSQVGFLTALRETNPTQSSYFADAPPPYEPRGVVPRDQFSVEADPSSCTVADLAEKSTDTRCDLLTALRELTPERESRFANVTASVCVTERADHDIARDDPTETFATGLLEVAESSVADKFSRTNRPSAATGASDETMRVLSLRPLTEESPVSTPAGDGETGTGSEMELVETSGIRFL